MTDINNNIHNNDYNENCYSFKSFEKYTQDKEYKLQNDIYNNLWKNDKNIKHITSMLPYTSGDPHLGHIRNYTITDIKSRGSILLGENVFSMMGFDSYGLPAENAAKIRGIQANVWTYNNIKHMSYIFNQFNFYDFGKFDLLVTCDSKYYKHQQKFLKYLFEKDILYRKKSIVNWDPVEKTVLANEQVINNRGWRSNAIIEQKELNQWFIRVSKYSEILLKNIDTLHEWPDHIKTMQRNWIGKSTGVHVDFVCNDNTTIKVFTTRPELIFGVNFISISMTSNITATHAYHPYTHKSIPIIKAEFVREDYATGAVMGVASTNDNDLNIAKKHNIEILSVIDNNGNMINSDFLNELSVEEARMLMMSKYENAIYYSLHDWCISRQRAWGCILPFIYCDKCGILPAAEEVITPPDNIDYTLEGNALDHYDSWKNVKCHKCNNMAKRETDTADTFVDSSWYLLRYTCQDNTNEMCDERTWKTTPVDIYVGGAEHATAHLIYVRVWMYLVCEYYNKDYMEPIICLMNQGMIVSPVYIGKDSGHYYHISEFDNNNKATICLNDKFIGEEVLQLGNAKMSKSYKNFDDLQELMKTYGTDALRMFSVSDSPYDQEFVYNIRNIHGCVNLLNKIWSIIYKYIYSDKSQYEHNAHYHNEYNILMSNLYSLFNKSKFNGMISTFHKLYRLYTNHNISSEQQHITILSLIKWLWCFCPSLSTKIYDIMKSHNLVHKNSLYEERIDIININNNNIKIFKVYSNNTKIGQIEAHIDINENDIVKLAIDTYNITSYQKHICILNSGVIKFII